MRQPALPDKREWMRERALLAHYFPGVGEPIYLTLPEWNGLLEQIPKLLSFGEPRAKTHRESVDENMRRMYG